ncbi:MAG: HlyD family efflux transporter periplasmic adaptor subunit [Gammaproteobacteria bacterium]|nr:HlyD family efflux transporter periplasmic adaptor subunit [Gammaproteobacteria bacterium]
MNARAFVQVATLALMVAGCDNGGSTNVAMGTLERDRIELSADTDEAIVEINVREGDAVASGEQLLRQDDARLQAQLEIARAQNAVAQARLDEVLAGPRRQAIEMAEAAVTAARARLQYLDGELTREQSLQTRSYASESRIDQLRSNQREARAQLASAQSALNEALEGSRHEEIEAARAALAAAAATVNKLELDVTHAITVAPVAGRVEVLPFETGERPAKGAIVAVLRAASAPYARVYVPEPLRAGLSAGDEVSIEVDGDPAPLRGRLRFIASEAAFTPYFALTQYDRSRLSYLAEFDVIDERGNQLPAGIPVTVRIAVHGQ